MEQMQCSHKEKNSWAYLYHASHIRENLISWLPFKGQEKVLEVGAEQGALTGALCRMAGHVTCVEPDREACRINEERHRDCENLSVLNGTLEAVEKDLTEKYDYIFLIGTLGRSIEFVDSRTSVADLLNILRKHLSPCGKLVIAMENRFGLKYWAGCAEERTGKLFEGLEGYLNTEARRSYTKKELQELMEAAGLPDGEWYYPFPDIWFPMTIYSDRRLPAKGELNRVEYNFQRLRMELFRESAVYDSIIGNEMYPQFANGFLVILDCGKAAGDNGQQIIYSKFSNERSPEFNIRTDICQQKTDGGESVRLVKKYPVGEAAVPHVQKIKKAAQLLAPLYARGGLSVNACLDGEGTAFEGIALEYLQGITLEEQLDHLLEAGREDEMEALFFSYLDKLEQIHQGEVFVKTPEFIRVFGDEELGENLPCAPVSNIDVVPANIFLGKEKTTVIDYEWTFAFPIPMEFLKFRMILYYLESDGKRDSRNQLDFYRKAGITPEREAAYRRMEEHFQRYMVGDHVSMLSLYEEISPGKADVKTYYEQLRESMEARTLQVFYDKGADFREEDSQSFSMGTGAVCMEIPVSEGTSRMRLDPGEAPGGFLVKRLRWDNGEKAGFVTNGFALGEGRFYFGGGDPQILIETIPEGVRALTMELEGLKEQAVRAEFWNKFSQQGRELQNLKRELKQRETKIREMENTKVWKLYRKLKKD